MTTDFDFDRAFGRLLADVRSSRDVSQRTLAARLAEIGVSIDSAALSRIEQGKRSVRLHEASAMAEALGVTLHELEPVAPGTDTVTQARQSVLRQIDEALYRLTGLAGSLNYLAVVSAPDEAWDEWATTSGQTLLMDDTRVVALAGDHRAERIRSVLRSLADGVVDG